MIEHRLLNVEKIISQFLIVKFFIGEADNSKFKNQNCALRNNSKLKIQNSKIKNKPLSQPRGRRSGVSRLSRLGSSHDPCQL